ncbi:MAG: hypothetical protein EBT67_12250, partial [Betaproteobacteria bacterium]|nr:hypothetical protein [Betaproteobacteria bacterium]
MKSISNCLLLGAALLTSLLSGCTSVMPQQAMTHSPQFEPVYPVQNSRETLATGAIYVGRQSDSWFGKGRNFQVGDVVKAMPNLARMQAWRSIYSLVAQHIKH